MEQVRTTWTAADGTLVTLRPIEAGDFALEEAFVAGLSASTGYKRLLSARRLSREEIRRFTEIDPECEFAVIATNVHDGVEQQVGVARYVKQGCSDEAEFAIVLIDDWQGRGWGGALLSSLIAEARQRGVRRVRSQAPATIPFGDQGRRSKMSRPVHRRYDNVRIARGT
jgi:acetyltransferase